MTQSNFSNPDKHHGGARTVTEEKLMVKNILAMKLKIRLVDMILIVMQ